MMSENYLLDNYERRVLELLIKVRKCYYTLVVLPCAGEVMEAATISSFRGYNIFYNSNICPKEEYMIRKEENKSFAEKLGMLFIDVNYNK